MDVASSMRSWQLMELKLMETLKLWIAKSIPQWNLETSMKVTMKLKFYQQT